jgi:hypothetical protein
MPSGLLPLCHWGCAIYSFVHCPSGRIFGWDPNPVEADDDVPFFETGVPRRHLGRVVVEHVSSPAMAHLRSGQSYVPRRHNRRDPIRAGGRLRPVVRPRCPTGRSRSSGTSPGSLTCGRQPNIRSRWSGVVSRSRCRHGDGLPAIRRPHGGTPGWLARCMCAADRQRTPRCARGQPCRPYRPLRRTQAAQTHMTCSRRSSSRGR